MNIRFSKSKLLMEQRSGGNILPDMLKILSTGAEEAGMVK